MPGTAPGFVQIAFPTKPGPAALAELRAARFRYNGKACPPRWYGLARNAPEAYAPALPALAVLAQRPDIAAHLEASAS